MKGKCLTILILPGNLLDHGDLSKGGYHVDVPLQPDNHLSSKSQILITPLLLIYLDRKVSRIVKCDNATTSDIVFHASGEPQQVDLDLGIQARLEKLKLVP